MYTFIFFNKLQQEGDVSNDQIHNNNNDSMQSSDLLQEVQEDQVISYSNVTNLLHFVYLYSIF